MAASIAAGRGKAAAAVLPHLVRGRCLTAARDSYQRPKLLPNQPLPSLRRAFSLYDQINLINKIPDDQLRFQGYTDTGFTINDIKYEGSLLIANNFIMSWSPTKFHEITADSLSIFQLLQPVPEILIFGCGKHIQIVDSDIRRFVKSTGMKLEAIDSRNAASTFNILVEEGRMVGAALLPYGVTC